MGTSWYCALAALLLASAALPPARAAAPTDDHAAFMEALAYIQKYSVWREGKDWSAIRSEAIGDWEKAETDQEKAAVFSRVFEILGDTHSSVTVRNVIGDYWRAGPVPTTEQVRIYALLRSYSKAKANSPWGKMLNARTAYLVVPSMAANPPDEDSLAALARKLDSVVCDLASHGARRWVIDLRYNSGGNMHVMLNGLAELIGDGLIGGAVDPNGELTPWTIEHGTFRMGGEIRFPFHSSCALDSRDHAIVGLVSQLTLSSGEFTSLAIRGRAKAELLGATPAPGYATINDYHPISTDFIVNLAVARAYDRNGHVFGESIEPSIAFETDVNLDDPEQDAWVAKAREILGRLD